MYARCRLCDRACAACDASLRRCLAGVPDAVAKPYAAATTETTMLVKWDYPYDDGVVVDHFEIALVQLPDVFIPVAQRQEEADRRAAEAVEARRLALERGEDPDESVPETDADASTQTSGAAAAAALDFDELDKLQPVLHTGSHRCEYLVVDSAPYTAFRVRVRAHSMVGWGPWGQWSLVTTKGARSSLQPRDLVSV